MVADEPRSPNCAASSLFLVGKSSRGNWVVQDERGLCGGLFVDRAEVVKFARFENANQQVIVVPGILELDMSGTPRASDRSGSNGQGKRAA